jgi:hypothetical protein
MNQACQSRSTLNEMLLEAATLVAAAGSKPGHDLSGRIDELRRALDASIVPSADAEHEIMSIYVLAELERARSGGSSLRR